MKHLLLDGNTTRRFLRKLKNILVGETNSNYIFNFRSETKELRHKTQFLTKYGPSRFFEIGLDARIEKVAELKTAEVSLGWKSSYSRLEDFQITAKAELQPKILDNTIRIKVCNFSYL